MNQMIALAPCEGAELSIVDDHVEALSHVTHILVGDGYEVREYTRIADAENEINLASPFWVIDKRFGRKSSGLELFEKLKCLPNKRVIMLTGFPSKGDKVGRIHYNSEINNLSVVIEKPDSFIVDAPRLASLIDELFSANSLPINIDDGMQDDGETELERFNALTEDEQDDVLDRVVQENSAKIEKAWKSGAVWLCIWGSEAEEIEAIDDVSEIPSSEEVDSKCIRKGLPAFVVDRTYSFHSIGCAAAREQGGANISTYPQVNIEFDGHSLQGFHFDSGADTSLFDRDFISGAATESVRYRSKQMRPEKRFIQSKPHTVREIEIDGLLKYNNFVLDGITPGPKQSNKGVTVKGWSVRAWSSSDLMAHCSAGCSNSEEGQICRFRRSGLIGRDFYIDNKLCIVLSHDDTSVSLIEKAKQ